MPGLLTTFHSVHENMEDLVLRNLVKIPTMELDHINIFPLVTEHQGDPDLSFLDRHEIILDDKCVPVTSNWTLPLESSHSFLNINENTSETH